MSDRLSTADSELSEAIRVADSLLRARAASLATHAAIAESQLGVDQRYLALSNGDLAGLLALVEELDAEYFNLQDKREDGQATTSQVDYAFGKARAASAAAFLAQDEMSESIYEAQSAVSQPSAILLLVRQALITRT